ncbi:unnamed protein product [Protopolystoma xenopodis]|uniref:Fibronectin type-III domain-containing protein n=1 Tax=Protopolystoma xenopodis TaxID=117903 RepID=A0A448WQ65_9PLAT|nr:unnamed protein product [Protopolystoma xenopodis]
MRVIVVTQACSLSTALSDPVNVRITSVTATSVNLAWEPASTGSGYAVTTSDASIPAVVIGDRNTVTATINGLEVCRQYVFTVRTTDGASTSTGVTTTGRPRKFPSLAI